MNENEQKPGAPTQGENPEAKERPGVKAPGDGDKDHLTRRGEAGDATLPPEQTPNADSPVPDEYRRDPSDDGLPG